MKVLELYSGTQCISNTFREAGHEVLSVELNDKFTKPPYNLDQWTISVSDVTVKQIIKRLGGLPDVVWASPMCTTESNMAISHHRTCIKGHGRTQALQKRNNSIIAKSDEAILHDQVLLDMLCLLQDLKPMVYYIENPMAGMRKNPLMRGVMYRHTITYCSYGDKSMKPTDIWTNHPDPKFKKKCHNGNKECHHESAPRGSRTGTQGKKDNTERSKIPQELCNHIVKISEELINE